MADWNHAIIAERRLTFRSNGRDQDVSIRIARPEPGPPADPDSFLCHWQAVGFRESPAKYASGEDAVQALQLALEMIGIDLEAWQRDYAGEFLFLGEPGHGFPTAYWDRAIANPDAAPDAHADAAE